MASLYNSYSLNNESAHEKKKKTTGKKNELKMCTENVVEV